MPGRFLGHSAISRDDSLAENSEAEAKTISLDLVALTLSGLGLITIELVGTLEGSDNVRAML